MYDDGYRKHFTSLTAATHNNEIISSGNKEKINTTHTHNHRDFEILLVKKGKVYFTIDENTFLAENGDVILVNPYEIHSAYTKNDFLPFSEYCITFDLSMLLASSTHPATQLCNKLTDGNLKFNHLIKSEEIKKLVLKSEQIFENKKDGWEFFISSILFEIFGYLYENQCYTIFKSPDKSHIFVKNVLEFIENNFKENITSSDIAEKLCYDKSYFCRLFRKNFGQNFGEYLNFYRIKYATELLKTGFSVSSAATMSGFNNLSYFTKIFKKHNGLLPSKFKLKL